MVYVYDNEIVTYLNFGVDKAIERVRLDETNAAIEGLKNVQTLSPLLHQTIPESLRGFSFLSERAYGATFASVMVKKSGLGITGMKEARRGAIGRRIK